MTQPSFRIARVLCPTDFSVFSSRAFRHAIAFAHQFRARVKVVHVLPLLPNVGGSPSFLTPVFPSPEQRQHAQDELSQFIEPAAGSGVEVTTETRDGQPWREILAAAEDWDADLVALGTHGRSGFERFLLGSVTEKLLGHLPCPTLTVCHEEGRTWEAPGLVRRILCATDFSSAAAEAVALALALADQVRSELTLIHVIDALPDAAAHSYAVPEIAPLRQSLEEHARPRLEAACPAILASGHAVEKRLVTGRAHAMILEAAAGLAADVIVLGTRGHGPVDQMLHGSTSERVVREATCPVITVPPAGAAHVLGHEAASSRTEIPAPR